MSILGKSIDVVAVIEVSGSLNFQTLPIEVGRKHDLAGQPLPLVSLFSQHRAVLRIKPQRNSAPVSEPLGMCCEVLRLEANHRSHDFDPISRLGVRSEEIMLGEIAYKPVA